MSYPIKTIVDAQGLICPEPVMMLHTAVRDAAAGDVIEVKATDPTTKRDIQQFCDFLGHELLLLDEQETLYTFHIKKSDSK